MNPKWVSKSFKGAVSPKQSNPITSSPVVKYLYQKSFEPASIATLGFVPKTWSLYSSDWESNNSAQGIETTLTLMPSASKSSAEFTANSISESC